MGSRGSSSAGALKPLTSNSALDMGLVGEGRRRVGVGSGMKTDIALRPTQNPPSEAKATRTMPTSRSILPKIHREKLLGRLINSPICKTAKAGYFYFYEEWRMMLPCQLLLNHSLKGRKRLGTPQQTAVDEEGGGAGDSVTLSLSQVVLDLRGVFAEVQAFVESPCVQA